MKTVMDKFLQLKKLHFDFESYNLFILDFLAVHMSHGEEWKS